MDITRILMKAKTKHETEKAGILKAARTAIRLKHSLAADKEMSIALPVLEKELDQALLRGKPIKISVAHLLDA